MNKNAYTESGLYTFSEGGGGYVPPPPPPAHAYLLLESGGKILLESGGGILLENQSLMRKLKASLKNLQK